MIKNIAGFKRCLFLAKNMIEANDANFVYVAQKPRFANQNMGWIEVGEKLDENEGIATYDFRKLIYRPKLEEAQRFFSDQSYVWNLGYFVTTPKTLVGLYKEYATAMFEQLSQIQESYGSTEFEERLNSIYPSFEKISFDDAILVKMSTGNVKVVATDVGWSDVGAWESLKEALADSPEENVTKGNVVVNDCRDTLVFSYTDQMVVGIDLNELLVINTGDVILVCPKTSVPKIKKFVEGLSGTENEKLA